MLSYRYIDHSDLPFLSKTKTFIMFLLQSRILTVGVLLSLILFQVIKVLSESPRFEVQQFYSPPDFGLERPLPLFVEGFRLKSIFVHQLPLEHGGIHRIYHHIAPDSEEFVTNEGSRRHLSEMSERERVLLFAKLNMAVYPRYESDLKSWGANVFEGGDGRYVPSDSESESAVRLEIYNNVTKDLNVQGEWNVSISPDQEVINHDSCGVVMGEFYSMDMTVLVFRGSIGFCDNHNMNTWVRNWFLNKMGPVYYDLWESLGLEITSAMKKRSESDDTFYRFLLRYGTDSITKKTFPNTLRSEGADLTVSQIRETGYWELTKEMVRQILPSDRDTSLEEQIYLTGHSQGGTRAQLVAMWLEKEDGVQYPTYTFGAPGTQCFTRRTTFGGDFLDDVDPYSAHDNVINYVDAIDPYGNMDYDTGGKDCTFMTSDLKDTMHAKYCAPIVGVSGAHLVLAADYDHDVAAHFSACRYWTHSIWSYLADLKNENYLFEDGTTDGGCMTSTIIPEDDPEGLCPLTAPFTSMEMFYISWMVIVPVLLCAGCCTCTICCLKRRRKVKNNIEISPVAAAEPVRTQLIVM